MANHDVLTYQEAITALGGEGPSPMLVESWVSAISLKLDEEYGPVVQRSVTDTFDGGGWYVVLSETPVSVVSAVTESSVALTASDYVVYPETGILRRRRGTTDCRWKTDRLNITVTYTAGRFASVAAVDDGFKRGAGIILRHLHTADYGSGGELFNGEGFPSGFAIPNRAFEVIGFPRRRKLPLVG